MPDTTPPPSGPRGDGIRRTDIGRRITTRREALGLSRQELAERSGTATNYIDYLEDRESAPGIGVMLRIADALQTTVPELTGGTVDRPQGRGSALRDASLRELGEDECRALLSQGGVGRVALIASDGPAVVPVNYLLADDEIVYRTAPDTVPASAAEAAEVAFEVDHIDDTFSQGWSVLVVGEARRITDPDTIRELEPKARGLAWAGGERPLWLAISPRRITGRRIVNSLGTPLAGQAGTPPPEGDGPGGDTP
ncbi:helix-turn-helix domain-containing protein [Streptomyces jumonjinensis]|uniref:Helix-turn-helix domain-containing protein n=1 Tax=Streptomyces jumonjinensis TaxID=1945 RepID=A0A646KID4_STRJU|nr:pyridoxamine 5'-phosphate oxidase family protein [Streptomyces jumonjinensis]MQT02032.1 helix-turn-helix domain-containing protein [Streptomyces jumonjinensis]